MALDMSENREPKAESKPLGRYTRHAGDTHDTESLLQSDIEQVQNEKKLYTLP